MHRLCSRNVKWICKCHVVASKVEIDVQRYLLWLLWNDQKREEAHCESEFEESKWKIWCFRNAGRRGIQLCILEIRVSCGVTYNIRNRLLCYFWLPRAQLLFDDSFQVLVVKSRYSKIILAKVVWPTRRSTQANAQRQSTQDCFNVVLQFTVVHETPKGPPICLVQSKQLFR